MFVPCPSYLFFLIVVLLLLVLVHGISLRLGRVATKRTTSETHIPFVNIHRGESIKDVKVVIVILTFGSWG